MEFNESLKSSSEKVMDNNFLTLTMETTSKYEDSDILNGFHIENSSNLTEAHYCQNEYMNISYMNVSCDSLIEYSVPLYGYMMPFLLIITVTANTLIILVLSKRNMSTPTNFVLKYMALCDMLTALFPAPGLFYMFTLGNHYKPLAPVQYCIIYSLFNEAVPAMFHTASIWLTLALAVQRYIFVCHAPMARTWCTMQRVKRCTFFILLAAFLHQVPRIFDTNTIGEKILWSNTTVEVCRMETASWVIDFGVDTYYISFFMFRIFFVHLIPCALLVTLNVLLFRAMKKAQDRRKKLLHDRNKDCSKTRDANCTTLMLIVVVTVFLIVEIPIAVITSLHVISSTIYVILDYNIANLFITFMNFFLVLSYPINFAIYCGMSRQFRVNFKEIFVKNSGPPGKKYSLVNGPRTCTNETVL